MRFLVVFSFQSFGIVHTYQVSQSSDAFITCVPAVHVTFYTRGSFSKNKALIDRDLK